jgi:pimeloyl-ACP methyl ester carboxylesterase
MDMKPSGVLIPGWASTASMYEAGLPAGWTALDPPPYSATRGALQPYVDWLAAELAGSDGPVVLAGHSMGGTIAVLAAAAHPERIARLVLVSPAVLPLSKSAAASLRDLGIQIAHGRFRLSDLTVAAGRLVAAPRSAARIALDLRRIDLSLELRQVHVAGVESTVIGCATDTMITFDHCRRAAGLLGARYRELTVDGGHLWMFAHPQRFVSELEAAAA